MKLQAGNYITRSGRILILTENAIKTGAVSLVAVGPGIFNEESGSPFQIHLGEGDLVLLSTTDGLIICQPYKDDVVLYQSKKGDAALLRELIGDANYNQVVSGVPGAMASPRNC